MRAGAFGWRGSAKAIDRLNHALSEIRAVNRSDPVTAAEGVVVLAERIWPAYEHIDTSSGALGVAVRRTLEKEGPFRVALVNGHTGIPWREQMIKSVRAWAARPENAANLAELRVVSTGPDVAAQIAAVDNFIEAGYDAVVFSAVNPTAFGAVIRRAERAGVVLVSFDNPVDDDSMLRITPNWIDFEAIKAQSVVNQMPQKSGRILEVRGVPGNSTDRDRHAGAEKALAGYPEISTIEVVGNWDTGTVQRVTADALAVHGGFDAVICQHGCRGVTNALAAAGMPVVPVGGDAENGFVKALAAGPIPGISVAAVVLGGTSLFGGSGRYAGTVAGVLLITLMSSTLSILQAPEAMKQIAYGIVIIVMVGSYSRKRA